MLSGAASGGKRRSQRAADSRSAASRTPHMRDLHDPEAIARVLLAAGLRRRVIGGRASGDARASGQRVHRDGAIDHRFYSVVFDMYGAGWLPPAKRVSCAHVIRLSVLTKFCECYIFCCDTCTEFLPRLQTHGTFVTSPAVPLDIVRRCTSRTVFNTHRTPWSSARISSSARPDMQWSTFGGSTSAHDIAASYCGSMVAMFRAA